MAGACGVGRRTRPLVGAGDVPNPNVHLPHPPTPISPIDGAIAASLRPNLRVLNAVISGGAGPVAYEYHLGDEGPTFPNPVVLMASPSGTGETSTQFEDSLAPDTQFW